MSRRHRAEKRPAIPDPRYGSTSLSRFTNRLMQGGKKDLARSLVYSALARIEQEGRDPIQTYELALRNATPLLQVKPRRVGGATYQVPVEVLPARGNALAMRWLIDAARGRGGRPMSEKLAAELLDAARGQGAAARRREELHRMAEANRAFAHYRW